MNIFVLDDDLELSVQYHCDKHVVKMMTEAVQIVSTVARLRGYDVGYEMTHVNHPVVRWAESSDCNLAYAFNYAFELCGEYYRRYGRNGKPESVLLELYKNAYPHMAGSLGTTPHPQVMPDKYKVPGCSVQAYRNYYLVEKSHIFKWTGRDVPWWVKDIGDKLGARF